MNRRCIAPFLSMDGWILPGEFVNVPANGDAELMAAGRIEAVRAVPLYRGQTGEDSDVSSLPAVQAPAAPGLKRPRARRGPLPSITVGG